MNLQEQHTALKVEYARLNDKVLEVRSGGDEVRRELADLEEQQQEQKRQNKEKSDNIKSL